MIESLKASNGSTAEREWVRLSAVEHGRGLARRRFRPEQLPRTE
jgi:hypothetical protein